MRRRVVLGSAAGIGVLAALLGEGVGGGGGGLAVTGAAAIVAFAALRWVLRRRAGPSFRAALQASLDPDGGPPAEAVSVPADRAAELLHALETGDEHTARRHLTEDFALVCPGPKRYGARRYLRAAKTLRHLSRTEAHDVLDVVAVPGTPGVEWVCQSAVRHFPHSATTVSTTWWERWTRAPDGRLAEVESAAVTRVA